MYIFLFVENKRSTMRERDREKESEREVEKGTEMEESYMAEFQIPSAVPELPLDPNRAEALATAKGNDTIQQIYETWTGRYMYKGNFACRSFADNPALRYQLLSAGANCMRMFAFLLILFLNGNLSGRSLRKVVGSRFGGGEGRERHRR